MHVYCVLLLWVPFLLLDALGAVGAVPGAQGINLLLGEHGERGSALWMQPASIRAIVLRLACYEEATLVRALARAEHLGRYRYGLDVDPGRLIQLVLHQFAVFVSHLAASQQNSLQERGSIPYRPQVLFIAILGGKSAKSNVTPAELVFGKGHAPVKLLHVDGIAPFVVEVHHSLSLIWLLKKHHLCVTQFLLLRPHPESIPLRFSKFFFIALFLCLFGLRYFLLLLSFNFAFEFLLWVNHHQIHAKLHQLEIANFDSFKEHLLVFLAPPLDRHATLSLTSLASLAILNQLKLLLVLQILNFLSFPLFCSVQSFLPLVNDHNRERSLFFYPQLLCFHPRSNLLAFLDNLGVLIDLVHCSFIFLIQFLHNFERPMFLTVDPVVPLPVNSLYFHEVVLSAGALDVEANHALGMLTLNAGAFSFVANDALKLESFLV